MAQQQIQTLWQNLKVHVDYSMANAKSCVRVVGSLVLLIGTSSAEASQSNFLPVLLSCAC
jgi:hypothetical protein